MWMTTSAPLRAPAISALSRTSPTIQLCARVGRLREVLAAADAEVIDRRHRCRRLAEQPIDDVAADEPGAAGDYESLSTSSCHLS